MNEFTNSKRIDIPGSGRVYNHGAQTALLTYRVLLRSQEIVHGNDSDYYIVVLQCIQLYCQIGRTEIVYAIIDCAMHNVVLITFDVFFSAVYSEHHHIETNHLSHGIIRLQDHNRFSKHINT